MNVIAEVIANMLGIDGMGVRCRSCGVAIGQRDDFGRSERACKRCRGR
jgi:hypothetical protein